MIEQNHPHKDYSHPIINKPPNIDYIQDSKILIMSKSQQSQWDRNEEEYQIGNNKPDDV